MLQACEDYGKQNSCQTKGRMTTGTGAIAAIARILPPHHLNNLRYVLIRKTFIEWIQMRTIVSLLSILQY